jgi:hypothetical protein
MEISQGNFLCSYLNQKCHLFSFTKLENRRVEQVLLGSGLGPVGRKRRLEEGTEK